MDDHENDVDEESFLKSIIDVRVMNKKSPLLLTETRALKENHQLIQTSRSSLRWKTSFVK